MAASTFISAAEMEGLFCPQDRQAALAMNAMYRYQRHIYDLTRKFYLFGRDELLAALPVSSGSLVLDLGCGTGRNLIQLAARRPGARLFGIDISTEMLETAARSAARSGQTNAISLAHAPGGAIDSRKLFGVDAFDVVYLSYVLSMAPEWKPLLEQSLRLLKPGGILAIVDFADQQAAPPWRRHLLLGWLKLFGVHPRPEIAKAVVDAPGATLIDQSDILSGYAYRVMLRKHIAPTV